MQHPHLSSRNNDFLIPGINTEEESNNALRPNMFGTNFLHRQFEAAAGGAFDRPKFFNNPEFRLKSPLEPDNRNNNKQRTSDFDLKGKIFIFFLKKTSACRSEFC